MKRDDPPTLFSPDDGAGSRAFPAGTPSRVPENQYVILCADDEQEVLAGMVRDLRDICGKGMQVEGCSNAGDVLELVHQLTEEGARIPLIVTDHVMPGTWGVDLLIRLQELPATRATRKVLLSARTTVEDVAKALNRGALHANLNKPWSSDQLRQCIRPLLTDYFIQEAPNDIDCFPDALDVSRLSQAFEVSELSRRALNSEIATLGRSFMADMDLTDAEVEENLIKSVDEALHYPPREDLPVDTVLLRQDEPVDRLYILTNGFVELIRRADHREVVMHRHTVGRIVGLLSLAHRQRAFFTCRAVTPITVIPLSLDQLEQAMQRNTQFSISFVTALIRSMATRSMRSTMLKVEIENLYGELRDERDALAKALQQLQEAQTRLVESEKMVTLGQLAAGMAHELNNPIAAIRRSIDFIAEDIMSLVTQLPHGERVKATLDAAMTETPISTRELRRRGQALAAVVGDDTLTRRMVKVGVQTPEAYRTLFGRTDGKQRERLLTDIERYHELGTSLRNVCSCSDRISEIIRSLRAYARNEREPMSDVDVHEGLEDTLRLFRHAMTDVHVKRSYGDIPTIQCHPGQINQVWSNIVSNALHAMHHKGEITLETSRPDPDHVCIKLQDTGRGIDPDVIGRIFEPHFTTKNGRVEFGLGLGLPIAKHIVSTHGGDISVVSEPGRTCFTVLLPIRFPEQLPSARQGESRP